MPKLYDESHPIINTKLLVEIKKGKENGSNEQMQNILTQLIDANFILPVQTKRNDDLIDVFMMKDEFGIYIPVFTNYLEMRKMPETKKNQEAYVMDIEEIVDLSFTLYEWYDQNVQGIIIDPYGANLFFDNKILDKIQQVIGVQQYPKIYSELQKILNTSNEDEQK